MYRVGFAPLERYRDEGASSPPAGAILRAEDGALAVTARFAGEQEHLMVVDEIHRGEERRLGVFRLYSLADDLLARAPYKGDLHIHSNRSDGREPPAHVAAACRRIGLDFMALTDHGLYAPSLEAQEAFRDFDLNLRIFRGEEIHPPGNPVHIVNFGGAFSVNELFADEQAYRRDVRAIEDETGPLPAGVDPYHYASAVFCFRKIREAGGLGIFCHPYWLVEDGYYISEALTTHLLETQPFDALELLGGYYRHESDSNVLQVARYHEERLLGRRLPIVGVSDAHGCERGELFGWYYTIVFAKSLELQDIIDGIKNLWSVAVEAVPGGTARAYGPFRLVKYALFLLREVFPAHDALCAEEGLAMLRYAAGSRAG